MPWLPWVRAALGRRWGQAGLRWPRRAMGRGALGLASSRAAPGPRGPGARRESLGSGRPSVGWAACGVCERRWALRPAAASLRPPRILPAVSGAEGVCRLRVSSGGLGLGGTADPGSGGERGGRPGGLAEMAVWAGSDALAWAFTGSAGLPVPFPRRVLGGHREPWSPCGISQRRGGGGAPGGPGRCRVGRGLGSREVQEGQRSWASVRRAP